jgi:hypothetical protein
MPARWASSSWDTPASARASLTALPKATNTGWRAWLGEARGMTNGHQLTPIAPRTIIRVHQSIAPPTADPRAVAMGLDLTLGDDHET